MARFALIPLLALTACAGSVTVEEIDGFGGVASALWVYDDDANAHTIRLTNVVGGCAKLQAIREAEEEFEDALGDIGFNDLDDYCEIMEEPTKRAAEAGTAAYHEGAHWLTLSVDGGDEPDDDTYEVDGDPFVAGYIQYFENSPYEAALSDYDPDEENDALCGIDSDDLEFDTDDWALDDGELEITAVNDEANASGTFEGELVDPEGDNEGDIRFSFTATYCEIG
jgi:hypothetical protein